MKLLLSLLLAVPAQAASKARGPIKLTAESLPASWMALPAPEKRSAETLSPDLAVTTIVKEALRAPSAFDLNSAMGKRTAVLIDGAYEIPDSWAYNREFSPVAQQANRVVDPRIYESLPDRVWESAIASNGRTPMISCRD